MNERTWSVAVLAALALLGVGCSGDSGGGDGDGDSDADADADSDADADGDCDPPDAPPDAPARGSVRVSFPTTGDGSALAQFSSDDVPPFHQETMREGDCRLLEYHGEQCQNCWELCVQGECRPFPQYVGAGTLTVTGLGSDVRIQDAGGYYYAVLAGRALDPGATAGVSASGGAYPAFEIATTQPSPIEADVPNDEITLEDGTDEEVHWTAVDPCAARVRLTLKSRTAAHGLPPVAMIECDVPDTGSLTIPHAIIEAFPETSHEEICVLVDCPASSLTRYTRATTPAGDSNAELVVESLRTLYVIHSI